MPSLQVRNLPLGLYQKLVEQAEKEHRSVAQEAVVLLAKSLDVDLSAKEKRTKILAEIKEDAEILQKYNENVPDPVEIIQNERERRIC